MGKKETRRKRLIKHILKQGSIPKNLTELAKKFNVSESTLSKDINEINQDLRQQLSNDLQLKLILKLNQNIHMMKTSERIRLFDSLSKKNPVKETDEQTINLHIWDLKKEKEKS